MTAKLRAIYLFMCGIAIIWSHAGCSGGEKDLPPEAEATVIRLHADILILDQRAYLLHRDSSEIAKGRDSLYARSGISKTSYEQAIANYRRDPDVWKAFNLKIITRLEELQKARILPKDSTKHKAGA